MDLLRKNHFPWLLGQIIELLCDLRTDRSELTGLNSALIIPKK